MKLKTRKRNKNQDPPGLQNNILYNQLTVSRKRIQIIFTYAGRYEQIILAISILAAIASGAGIALQNLIFGNFVTTINDFVIDPASGGDKLRHDSAKLA
jgi:hypothetical protein